MDTLQQLFDYARLADAMGKLPRAQYINVLQVSAAHVYLTYPFVLSWSLLEAMACGANIVASNTAPVREVVRDGESGMLVPFFDAERIAARLSSALDSHTADLLRRQVAQAAAARYSRVRGQQAYERMLDGAMQPTIGFPPSPVGWAKECLRIGSEDTKEVSCLV